MHDRYMKGYEGYGIAVNSRGIEELNAAKAIPVAGWFLGVVMPTAEAFAPIYAMQQRILFAAVLLTLLTGALTWWTLQRQLAPMLKTAHKLTLLATTNLPVVPLQITHQDEVGNLIHGFNQLMEVLQQRSLALADSEQRFRSLMEQIQNVAVQGYALDGTVTFWNAAAERLYGYSAQEAMGGNLLNLIIPAEMREGVRAAMQGMTQTGKSIPAGELLLQTKDGGRVPVFSSHALLTPTGGPSELFCLDVDLSETKRAQTLLSEMATRLQENERQLRQMAFFDPLTQLPNRRLLDDRLSQALAASKRSALYGALMFLDLDNFKPLNDTHGHGAGDLLLAEVARRLTGFVRETDTVARLGGDEFVVLLSELHADKTVSTGQAGAVAEKIRCSLAEPYLLTMTQPGDPLTTVEHHCSASIGVVLFVNHLSSQTDLMKWADAAMYQAKDAGRNVVRFYESNVPPALVNSA
jgi:diguanylate cyclase (GGDEF)-like protein/PAS domain S-box-containing protein